MPELPEVETTRRGIEPHLLGRAVSAIEVRQPRLRWPVPPLGHLLGQTVRGVRRRAKYLLIDFDSGVLILHLGMSGSLRVLPADTPPGPHDHFDLTLDGHCLRLRDPRRFGAVLWHPGEATDHPLLRTLGPEPLSDDFDADHLYTKARGRKVAIKQLLMDGKVVVGVGNIYATEALFLAGIAPGRACNRISRARITDLVEQVKAVLARAIEQGGTTLRDFQHEDGRPGYFQQELLVYGREGQPCPHCGTRIKARQIAQRTSAWCPRCQH
jgi:formamidopyrimidine-DNA glycosylase